MQIMVHNLNSSFWSVNFLNYLFVIMVSFLNMQHSTNGQRENNFQEVSNIKISRYLILIIVKKC